MNWKKQIRTLIVFGGLFIMAPLQVTAQTSSSNNYKVEEAQFGSGGEVDLNSANFNAQAGVGSLGVGSASSANYDVEAGFLTQNSPYLEFSVNTTDVSLGTLTDTTTGTGNATFYVRTYLSSSYDVFSFGAAPTNGSAQLDPMTSTAASSPGTEQFGLNLRANTSPITFGADPVNVPDDSFADGEANTGYNVVNQYRYIDGESIARSAATVGNQAVGRTDYTVSFIANVSAITEGGTYTTNLNLVAVPTY